MLSRRSTFLCNIFLPTTRACCYSTTATTTTVSSTNTYSKSQRAHIQDSAEELNNFSVDNFIQQQEQQQKQAPPRIGKADIRPSLSQAQKDRYLKNPYKLDKRGNPVWDYYKLKAFRPSRYPAIETEQIFTPKQPRYEYLVKSAQDVANKHEFRNHVTSEELLAAGVSLDKTQASNKVAQIFDWKNANKGEQAALKKQTAIARFQIHPSDTGSAPAQIAVLTETINTLTNHLNKNKKDIPTARRLQVLTHRRKKMLKYLRETDGELYWKTVHALDLRIQL